MRDAPRAVVEVDDNLARLRALDVFQVGQLIVAEPGAAHSCYGPCPGAETAMAAAKAAAAVRLAKLAEAAKGAAASPAPSTCDTTHVDEHLAALSALHIVGVGGLVVTQPANNKQCYNLPCPADEEAAKAANCARAAKLAAIVVASKGL